MNSCLQDTLSLKILWENPWRTQVNLARVRPDIARHMGAARQQLPMSSGSVHQ